MMILERTKYFECQFWQIWDSQWEDFKKECKENRRDEITGCIINQQELIIERRAREGDVGNVPVKASVDQEL